MLWKLRTYLQPYWKSAVLAPILMLLEVSMDLLQPKLMAHIVNEGIMNGDLSLILGTGLQMTVIAMIGLIAGAGCTVFSTIASQNFGTDLRNDLMAMTISLKLTLILVFAVPALFTVLYVLIRLSFPLFTKVQSRLDRVNTVLRENLSGIRVVKSFVRSDYERQRFAQANRDFTGNAIQAARILALNMPVMMLIMNVSIVAVLWYGGSQTWNGSLSVGELIAFIQYVSQLLFSMLMLGNMLSFFSRAQASAARIHDVLVMEPESESSQTISPKAALPSGELVFDHVSFAYDDEQKDYVLQDICFRAEPGQTIAILGATGAGKSSLVHLIPRFYEATKGRVLIDGVDVNDIPLDVLRSRIGIVLQQSILFSGKLSDNIRFGKPDAAQEEVEAAAKAAEAHPFIMQLPDGYDTNLGQRGVNLSGGQKQRIAIARALLMRPRILILDDSTSALDLGTESRIQKALKELMKHSTNLIIAQRISSVIDADKILVLEHGRIVAEGTHDELLRSSPIYQEIYRSQWKEEDQSYVRAQ